jgi:uncharacterized damage-inducible protein DinB
MQWANSQVLAKVAELPDEALISYIVNPEWTVGEIIRHIARAAHLYALRLEVDSPDKLEGYLAARRRFLDSEKPVSTAADVRGAAAFLNQSDSNLIETSLKADGIVYAQREELIQTISKSTILAQSIHHATEHRAQLVDALDFKGFNSIALDNYDLWEYNTFLNP